MKNIISAFILLFLVTKCLASTRDYIKQASLTAEEEKIVIEIALKSGIKEIDKIYTYNIHPSSYYGIGVKEKETITGRDIKYKVLMVSYKKWLAPDDKPGKNDVTIGDFWAESLSSISLKILIVDEKEYRAGVNGMPLNQCELIIKLFQDGKYTLAKNVSIDLFKHIDLNKPRNFYYDKTNSKYLIYFDSKDDGYESFSLTIKFDDNHIDVINMITRIS